MCSHCNWIVHVFVKREKEKKTQWKERGKKGKREWLSQPSKTKTKQSKLKKVQNLSPLHLREFWDRNINYWRTHGVCVLLHRPPNVLCELFTFFPLSLSPTIDWRVTVDHLTTPFRPLFFSGDFVSFFFSFFIVFSLIFFVFFI